MATEWISPTWRMPEESNQSKFENYSLDFDGSIHTDVALGTTTYLLPGQPTVGGFTNNPKYSASIFFNFDSAAVGVVKWMFAAGRGGGSTYWYLAKTAGDVLEAKFRTGSGGSYAIITGGTRLSHSTWYHACVTWDGSNINLYLNGVSDATQVAATTFYWYDTPVYPPYSTIGSFRYAVSTTTNRWEGKLGQATVFDYALSLTQIKYLWDNNAGGTTPNPQNPMAISGNAPIAYYPLGGSSTGDADDPVTNTLTVPNNSVPSATVFDFDGTNPDEINCGTGIGNIIGDSYTGGMGISLWFKTDSTAGAEKGLFIFSGGVDAWGEITAYFAFDNLYIKIKGVLVLTYAFTDTTSWHNLFINLLGPAENNQVYLDGGAIGSPFTYTDLDLNGETLNIGYTYSTTYDYQGQMSNFQVWNTSLDLPEVETLYNNGVPLLTGTQPEAANLKGWWKLNVDNSTWNGSNWSITDSSGEGNTGTSSGMNTANLVASDLTRSIPYSSYSMVFDGIGDYIDCGQVSIFNSATAITMSGWFKQDTLDTENLMLGTVITTSSCCTIYTWSDGNMYIHIADGANSHGSFDYSTVITAQEWFHMAVVYDGTGVTDADKVKLYINNNPITLSFSANPIPTSLPATQSDFYIGSSATYTATQGWNGEINNTAVWNSALNEDQILTIYNGGVPNDISSLSPVSWWSLAGDSYFNGNDWICPDLGSGGNNGTSSGMGGTELVGDGPGSTANGISTAMNIPDDLKGDAPNSSNNAFSVNMPPQSRVAF